MNKEEKDLLLKDLCARLPYGVKCQIDYDNEEDADLCIERYRDDRIVSICVETEEIGLYEASEYFYPDEIKPYLRSMSNMTEEEVLEYCNIKYNKVTYKDNWKRIDVGKFHNIGIIPIEDYLDWLNSHHFDYRGLIPMGLALEALPNMYE